MITIVGVLSCGHFGEDVDLYCVRLPTGWRYIQGVKMQTKAALTSDTVKMGENQESANSHAHMSEAGDSFMSVSA